MAQNVAKCPACGALRTSVSAVCSECGYEYNDVQVSNSIKEFTDKINELDERIARNQAESEKKGVGVWTVLGWIFLYPVMIGIFLYKKAKAMNEPLEGEEAIKSKAIINFPIPNSKEDLVEFAILANSRVKPLTRMSVLTNSGAHIQRWNKIWNEKGRQISQKAEFALRDDQSTLNQIKSSVQKSAEIEKTNDSLLWSTLGILCLFFIILWIFLIIAQGA